MIQSLRHFLKLPAPGFVFFLVSVVFLAGWEVIRLATPPPGKTWATLRRRVPPIAVTTTAIAVVLIALRFAVVGGLI